MIKEDYISFETAKLLKEKGFFEATSGLYDCGNERMSFMVDINWNDKNDCPFISAPTLQMAMKWLLETHNIFITILQAEHTTVTMEQEYFFYRIQKNRKSVGVFTDTFMKPEQACEAAIKYCLENLI